MDTISVATGREGAAKGQPAASARAPSPATRPAPTLMHAEHAIVHQHEQRVQAAREPQQPRQQLGAGHLQLATYVSRESM